MAQCSPLELTATGGCRGWIGLFDAHGWPVIWADRRRRLAWAVAWEVAAGRPVPAGMIVLPECDGCACVRPDHLCLEPSPHRPPDKARAAPLTDAEAAFIYEWVHCLGLSEKDASRALGGMNLNTVRRGLRLAQAASRPL
jgi:hypothetical protein